MTFLVYPDWRRRPQICLYGRPARKENEAIQEEKAIERMAKGRRTMVVK
jgi:hypothetical protein